MSKQKITLVEGLVSFLIDRHRPKFDIWRQGVDNGVEPQVVWQKQFGGLTPDFSQSFEAWLRSNASPWQVVYGEWHPAAETIEGRLHEDEFAVAILTETPRQFKVALEPSDSGAVGGIVFGFRGGKNFCVLQHSRDGHWDLMHYRRRYFPEKEHRAFDGNKADVTISIMPGENRSILKFGGHTVSITNSLGHIGLWVKEGRQRFRCGE